MVQLHKWVFWNILDGPSLRSIINRAKKGPFLISITSPGCSGEPVIEAQLAALMDQCKMNHFGLKMARTEFHPYEAHACLPLIVGPYPFDGPGGKPQVRPF